MKIRQQSVPWFQLKEGLAFFFWLLITSICCPAQTEQLRPFTIKDSIELSQFANPAFWTTNQDRPVAPIPSPDGHWVLVNTVRGILSINKIEATIWLFDEKAISNFVLQHQAGHPVPRVIARFVASTNTPVISDVRWLRDSRRVAFLAKLDLLRQQLYVVDTGTGKMTQLTHDADYVSAFDIEGDTAVYTTLNEPAPAIDSQSDLVDVTGRDIFSLLWRDRPLIDRDEAHLVTIPNVLHLVSGRKEHPISFTMDGRPLRLFFPILSLSPNGQFVITVAPVNSVPVDWSAYQPHVGYEDLKLTPNNPGALAETNPWRAAQMVMIDLHTGIASALVNAPAGRSMFFNFAPTKIIWSADSQRALLTNTFLPIDHATNATSSIDSLRAIASAVAIVDIKTHLIQPVALFQQPPKNSETHRHVSDITWAPDEKSVTLFYASIPDNVPLAFREVYRRTSTGWTKVVTPATTFLPDVELSISQDLNHAPVLAEKLPSANNAVTIWDPNPQLSSIALGKASLYRWHDKEGTEYTGILVLPADFVPTRRYPLVIQTHGYEPNKFFSDGIYTTGSGGRALVARGVVVLQTGGARKGTDTPEDGRLQIAAYEGAIQQLSSEGVIDPDRVGVIGFSFTVFHVLYALTHKPELFSVASITDGNDLSYWLYLLWTDIPFAQRYGERMNGGSKPFGREGLLKWMESAPGFSLERVRAPLLISCFEKGTLVSTWDIYGSLRTLGKPVEMEWLRKEDAPHVLVQPRHRYLSQQEAVDWFDFWLNGHEDNDPAKTATYERWHKLRDLQAHQP